MTVHRRSFITALGALASAALAGAPVRAQQPVAPSPSPEPPPARFGLQDVVRRARDLAAVSYDATPPQLPEPLARLDFDAYRDIRFRPERALLANGPFRMHMFHLGFLFRRPVTVNVLREGVPAPGAARRRLLAVAAQALRCPAPRPAGGEDDHGEPLCAVAKGIRRDLDM